jgi:hypothetical protein
MRQALLLPPVRRDRPRDLPDRGPDSAPAGLSARLAYERAILHRDTGRWTRLRLIGMLGYRVLSLLSFGLAPRLQRVFEKS